MIAPMPTLLKFSRTIDWLNNHIGRLAYWLILVAVLVSAGNAVSRSLFDASSNAWLELQWVLFSGVFLLCGGYALLHNAHVRIDVVYVRWSRRTQLWIDIFGTVFFLLPMAMLILALSWPVFLTALHTLETSSNSGGLIVWPARLLMPSGFLLLSLQGVSELIKRVAILRGIIADPALHDDAKSAEEALADSILAGRQEKNTASPSQQTS